MSDRITKDNLGSYMEAHGFNVETSDGTTTYTLPEEVYEFPFPQGCEVQVEHLANAGMEMPISFSVDFHAGEGNKVHVEVFHRTCYYQSEVVKVARVIREFVNRLQEVMHD